MSEANFLAGQASLWVQPDGPNTLPLYLGCHGVGDVDEPKGDKTLTYCPDRSQTNKFLVQNSYKGEPGAVTFSIDTIMKKTADYLEQLGECGIPIYIHKVLGGRRDTFTNFDRTFAFYPSDVAGRGIGNFAARQPTDQNETTQSFEISADELVRGFNLQTARISILDTEDITGVAVCGEERCEGDLGPSQSKEDYIFLATTALVGSAANIANVLLSSNGSAFTATAADPFAGEEDIQGIVCFRVGRDTVRVMVARGTTDAADPAEIAYSDDWGATWTAVDVGAVTGEYVVSQQALFALDRYHIWLGTDGGNIYFSADGGVTWTLQEAAAISATDVVAISFVDTDIGFALYTGGEVAKTSDGSASGATWSAATAISDTGLRDIEAITPYFLWAAGDNGMHYSHDAGVTWANRNLIGVTAISFLNDLFGIAVGEGASAPILQTINGGFDWMVIPAVTNAGFTDAIFLDSSLAYIAGAASGGTGFAAKLQPQV